LKEDAAPIWFSIIKSTIWYLVTIQLTRVLLHISLRIAAVSGPLEYVHPLVRVVGGSIKCPSTRIGYAFAESQMRGLRSNASPQFTGATDWRYDCLLWTAEAKAAAAAAEAKAAAAAAAAEAKARAETAEAKAAAAAAAAEAKARAADQARQTAENRAAAAEAARQMAESREEMHNRQRLEAEKEAAYASKAKTKVEAQAQFFGRFW
jgi:hypothetical protein